MCNDKVTDAVVIEILGSKPLHVLYGKAHVGLSTESLFPGDEEVCGGLFLLVFDQQITLAIPVKIALLAELVGTSIFPA